MYIERVLYPVEVLGVGKRIGIWVQGCWHQCKKCINRELWTQNKNNNIPVDALLDRIKELQRNNHIDGITITGGDPLYQIDELLYLLFEIRKMNLETLVYTGFFREEILEMKKGKEILKLIDVLIDGPYIDEKNIDDLSLRGSENQKIYFISEETRDKYNDYMKQGRKLQNFYIKDYILSVGIHNKPKEG